VYEVDDFSEYPRVCVGLHPVPQIEDVTCMTCVVSENVFSASDGDVGTGEHECGVKIALHHGVRAETLPSIGDGRSPVEPDDFVAH
jgi:hypothetical protein